MADYKHPCPTCHQPFPEKGRAFDGRRAYRCKGCGKVWSEGLQGRERKYSPQREGYQFADTGAVRHSEDILVRWGYA